MNGREGAMTKYVLPVRVYLEDTDAQGVVYNASYFANGRIHLVE